jgi:hypothetical protein
MLLLIWIQFKHLVRLKKCVGYYINNESYNGVLEEHVVTIILTKECPSWAFIGQEPFELLVVLRIIYCTDKEKDEWEGKVCNGNIMLSAACKQTTALSFP